MGIGKLSRRLFLLTLIALIPAAIVLFYNLYSIRIAKEEEVREEALRAGQLATLEMQRIISGAENVLIALSAAPVIQAQDSAGCQAYLARVGARLRQFSGFAVVDMNGLIVCRQTKEKVGLSLGDRFAFQEVMKTGNFVVGLYSIGRISGKPILPLALPIKGDGGKTFGVIIGALNLDWLGQRLRERDFARNSALTIADREGTILAREPMPEKFIGTKIMPEYMKLVDADAPGTMTIVSRDGTERVLGYFPANDTPLGLFVSAGIATNEAYATIRNAARIGLVATLVSLLLSFLLAWLTSRQLVQRPVTRLISTIQGWRSGDEAARTGMSERGSEFGVVGKAIDDFLSELVKARQSRALAERQRELLIGELDHRVKNLLATVQSIARQTFKDNASPAEAVSAFNRRLAALSEAHALLMKDNWRSAGMRNVVAAAIRPFDSRQFEISGPDFFVKAKAVLSLSMALHELATNAVKYGALKSGEGRIAIRWETGEIEPGGEPVFRLFWVERDGPPVTPPLKSGFGSKMIERVLTYELEATVVMEYPPTGMTCTLTAPLEGVRAENQPA